MPNLPAPIQARKIKKIWERQNPLHSMNQTTIPNWDCLFALSAVKGLSFGIATLKSIGA
jgi:hypothetical protein